MGFGAKRAQQGCRWERRLTLGGALGPRPLVEWFDALEDTREFADHKLWLDEATRLRAMLACMHAAARVCALCRTVCVRAVHERAQDPDEGEDFLCTSTSSRCG